MSEALMMEESSVLEPITNDLDADEALQAIREAQDKIAKMKEWYAHAMDLIEQQQNQIIENETERLRAYFGVVPHHVTKTQESYTLPSGKLMIKDQQPEFDRDDEKLIEWCEHNCEKSIKIKKTVDWAGLKAGLIFKGDKAVFKKTGEVVPGITVIERDPIFAIGK